MTEALQHLVLVAGHAVYVGADFLAPANDANWSLQDFQRGEPPFYIEHMHAGVTTAAGDPSALLVISGGQSRKDAGPVSEAAGYLALAEHFEWWSSPDVRGRAVIEEYARDSFENLLFGICRFREISGRYPERITAVSWAFKRDRFDRHRDAIRFPSQRMHFDGVNQPVNLAAALEGERRALADFAQDPYGTGPALAAKRESRNPFDRTPPYAATCPEIAGLLAHRGPERFRGPLPWDEDV